MEAAQVNTKFQRVDTQHGYELRRIMYRKTSDNFQRLSPQNREAVMPIIGTDTAKNHACNRI